MLPCTGRIFLIPFLDPTTLFQVCIHCETSRATFLHSCTTDFFFRTMNCFEGAIRSHSVQIRETATYSSMPTAMRMHSCMHVTDPHHKKFYFKTTNT
ncbi:hypothetical protein PAHAL_4G069900 [Panicum hallii]|uniref:Uncharacterized protein n=1 Tax=Panicum hallii TaxID=206008 RepID=A0A2T8JC12_9POAL|nr:hypothetical protein PAHAL_4G069900 [Panicum hallii]